jgi:hypothetical protein
MLADTLKVLVERSIQGNLAFLDRVSGAVRRAAREWQTHPEQRRFPTGGDLVATWLDFNLKLYARLTDQSLAFLHDVATATEQLLGLRPSPAAPGGLSAAGPAPRAEISLEGRPGETATSGFLLENSTTETVSVSFAAGQLVSTQGETRSAELIRFDPPTLTLEPRAQRIIQVSVEVSREFQVGETYLATIKIVGLQAREVVLRLTILPAPAASDKAGGRPVP